MRWPCQASEHDADHRELDGGGDSARISLEIARQAAIAADPGRVLLTIQRLGRTTNLCSSLRLTISTTQWPLLAALRATRGPW
jgi:hypothetical protein